MNNMKIVIIIRVYNRVWDLMRNLDVITQTWKNNNYDILVVSNGTNNGFVVPDLSAYPSAKLIILDSNSGHFSGNAQLLIEGAKNVHLNNYDYVILLEADTWMYGDDIICKYIKRMQTNDAVWASAKWYDKFLSLATDFAIVKADFLNNNIAIFDFAQNPECCVYNYLHNNGFKYVYIRENMPPMLPSYIKKYPFAPTGRFYTFPYSKMVTHHIEDYPDNSGKNIKLSHFNAMAGFDFFDAQVTKHQSFLRFKIKLSIFVQRVFLRRSWYSKVKQWNIEK